MSDFNPTTAVPVIERPDGLMQEDSFDPTTAKPKREFFFEEAKKPHPRSARTEEEKAEAAVEYMYKQQGKNVPGGLYFDWVLTGRTAQSITEQAMWGAVTGGLNFAVGALTGLVTAEGDPVERMAKGIFSDEMAPQIVTKYPGYEELPTWSKVVAGVSEEVIKYGVMGISIGAAKQKLFARSMARKLDRAADVGADRMLLEKGEKTLLGEMPKGQGVLDQNMQKYVLDKAYYKDRILQSYYEKLGAVNVQGMQQSIGEGLPEGLTISQVEKAFRETPIYKLLGEELGVLGEAGQIIPKVGQSVSFFDGTQHSIGKIVEIVGNRAKIDVAGKMIFAALDQLMTAAYHGTTKKFKEFSLKDADPESDLGAGIYFTTSKEDVVKNYATPEGPDITNKIERMAERIQGEYGDRDLSDEEAKEMAIEELKVKKGKVIPAELSIDNPVIIGTQDETYFDIQYNIDEEGGESEQTGKLLDFFDALKQVYAYDANIDLAISDVYQKAVDYGGLGAAELIDTLKNSEGLMYATDDEGRLYGNEIIRQAFENMGYDAIIDNNVFKKFGAARKYGKGMQGVEEDTIHYVVFKPSQIKKISKVKPKQPLDVEKKVPEASEASAFIKKQLDIENEGKTLTPEEQEAQDFAINQTDQLLANYEERVADEFPGSTQNVVSADVGKFAIPGMTAERSAAYHETGSSLAKYKYEKLLKDESTKNKEVMFTAGGSGSGKSMGLRVMAEHLGLDQFAAIYDTNLNKIDSAKKKIDQAIATGRYVLIQYTHRDPVMAWINGVLPRVKKQNRIVPIVEHINTHMNALDVVKKLSKEYSPDDVGFVYINNTGNKEDYRYDVKLETLKEFGYTRDELEDILINETKKALKDGVINESQYRVAVKGTKAEIGAEEKYAEVGGREPGLPAESEGWADEEVISPKAITPKNGRSSLDQKIQNLKDMELEKRFSQEALDSVKAQQDRFKGRIKPYKDGHLMEEYKGIPAKYRSKEGITMDEAAAQLSEMFYEEISEANLSEYLKDLDAQADRLKQQIKDLKTPYRRMKEITYLKGRIRDIQTGIRQGKIASKKDIAEIQSQVMDLLKNSELDTADKGRFMATMKNIQTADQLNKAYPQIVERIQKIEELRKKQDLIQKFKDLSSNKELKKLRPEYRKPVEKIINKFDKAKISEAKLKDLGKLADYLAANPDNSVPQDRIDELKRLELKPLRDLTADEIETIVGAIQHLVKLNELKNKIIVGNKVREFTEIKDQAVLNVNKKFDELDGSISGLDSTMKTKEDPGLKRFAEGSSLNTELKAEILDGSDGDVIMKVLYDGIDKGTDAQIRFMYEAEDFFKARLAGLNMDNWSASFQKNKKDLDMVEVKISHDRTLRMTKGERIAFFLHSLNLKNERHLLEGGFAFPNTPTKIIKISYDDIADIINSMTPGEMRVANAIHEYFNTIQKDRLNEISVKLNGIDLATEDNYFPIRTNYLDRFRDELLKGEMALSAKASLEGQGMFKQRQDASNAIILEDAFVAVTRSLKTASAYYGLAQPLRFAKALVNDNEFQKSVIDIGKRYYIDQFKDYLRRIEGEYVRMDDLDKLTQDMINKLDLAILGFKPFIIMKQPISYILASTEMDMKYLSGAFKLAPTDAEIQEIYKYAPQLRERMAGNISREVGEVMNIGFTKKFFTGKNAQGQWIMEGIRLADQSAITSIWRSVKAMIKDKYPSLTGDDYFNKVYEEAWKVIRRTQPTFHIKDRSPIGMKRELFFRLMTKYSSQRNKNMMIARRLVENYNRSHKTPKDKSKLAGGLFTLIFAAGSMLYGVNRLEEFVLDKDPEQSVIRKRQDASEIEKYMTGLIEINMGNIYFLGNAFSSLLSKLQKGAWLGYDMNDPVTSTIDQTIGTLTEAVNTLIYAITNERYKPETGRLIGEKKWKDSAMKAFEGALDLSGKFVFRFPIDFWRKFIKSQYQREEKKKERRVKKLKKIGF